MEGSVKELSRYRYETSLENLELEGAACRWHAFGTDRGESLTRRERIRS